jgi:hypothetical protein
LFEKALNFPLLNGHWMMITRMALKMTSLMMCGLQPKRNLRDRDDDEDDDTREPFSRLGKFDREYSVTDPAILILV